MAKLTGFIFLVLFSSFVSAQDPAAVQQSDSARKNFFKIFQWTEVRKGQYQITVPGYDSLKMGNNDFQHFYYSTGDKPDGKLAVKDEHGNTVRTCVYKGRLMFDEHWWFSTGEKEFEGDWSTTTNEYGDQFLLEYKWYYKNGNVRKHGFRTGVTTTYYANGKKESEKTFKDGKADGPYKEYFPNDRLQIAGQYFDGNKTGEWIYYNPDGTVQSSVH